jgi:tetratricopeptide (TPR) repeat protein
MRHIHLRPAIVVFASLCAWTAVTVPSHGQQSGASTQPFPASAWRAIAHGKPAEAETLARARPAGDPAAAAILGRLEIDKGRYQEAIAILQPAAARVPLSDAALELGVLFQKLGRPADGSQLLNVLFRASENDPVSLARAARAAAALGRAREANSLFRSASAPGSNPALDTAWGLLFFEKYNWPEAVKSFQQALAADPDWAPAHAGLARTLAEDDPPAAAAAATRALEIDPQLADAELLLAQLDLDNTRWDAARERVDRVLAANPSHLDARALAAAIAYVRGSRAAFDVEAKKALAINPAYGEVYREAAQLSARNYRFDEAVSLAREAVSLDPTNARAHAELGMHQMRTGDEAQARQSLDRAFQIDPYDKVTWNLLALLDKLDKFQEFREGDIVLKLDPAEAPVLREYAMPLAQEALKTLSAKYQFKPKGPILVEVFPVHDDFAVRTLGLPGMIGALGACFGRVVSLDSPHARPGHPFSWQATLWHEMTHVITLQMSNQRIPRWLTEGISEYEETQARPEWGREMEIPFAMALERGKALKLADLNSGFTRPDTIAIAYFEASLLVDHIVRTYGQAKLQALVQSYAQGLEGDAAVEKTVGVSIPELQASFDKALDARFGAIRTALRAIPGATGQSGKPGEPLARPAVLDVNALRDAASAHPGNYTAQLAYGQVLAAAGDRAAFAPLEKAAALVPGATGEDSPHIIMAKLAEQLGDTARAMSEYRAALAQDHTTVDAARSLAALAEKAAAPELLLHAYDRIVAIDPFDPLAHSGLGRLALKNSQAETAVREFKAALALAPADKASAHCDLAEAYLLANRANDAKAEALAALEIAPSYDRAQELLLKAIKGSGAAGGGQ